DAADDASSGWDPSRESLLEAMALACRADDVRALCTTAPILAFHWGFEELRLALLAGLPPSTDAPRLWDLVTVLEEVLHLSNASPEPDHEGFRDVVAAVVDLPVRWPAADDRRAQAAAVTQAVYVHGIIDDEALRTRAAARLAATPLPERASRGALAAQQTASLGLGLVERADALAARLAAPLATQETLDLLSALRVANPAERERLLALAAELARDDDQHGHVVRALVRDGTLDEAQAYASRVLRGVFDLSRAMKMLSGAWSNERFGRWAAARLEVIALVHALRDPEAAADAYDDVADEDTLPPDTLPKPHMSHHVRVLRLVEPVLARVREALARRATELAKLAEKLTYDAATEGLVGDDLDAWHEDHVSAWLIETRVAERLARMDVPAAPRLEYDPDDDDSPYPDFEDERPEYEEAERQTANRVGATSAQTALAHMDDNGMVAFAVTRWAEGEGLLGDLPGRRLACSVVESRKALYAVRYTLEGLALEAGRPEGHGSLDTVLRWALGEGLIDDNAASAIRSGSSLPTNWQGT
ncbi:MAG: hypothetical protein WCJ30_23380, partial [Deltaproteobacteria bacterium]